nr:glycosyltransferase [uncultured Psychroserpens sp.]
MTIIHLSSSLGGGGAEQMVLQLAKKSTPHIKTLVFSVSKDNTLEAQFKAQNIECHFLNVTSFKNGTLIQGVKKLHEIINSLEDVVFHSHQYHGFLIGLLYNLFYKKKPIVFTLHSSTIESASRRLILFLTKPFRKVDIIFSSNAQKWFLKKGKIIPNGVDFDQLSIQKTREQEITKPFVFLFLGRLSDEKNPLYMVTAANQLLRNGITSFIFDVVGEGNQKTELLRLISSEGLENYFNILGFKSNIKPYLEASNCLILPSKWEGMPMVIIEAAAAKLPIIATPVGSIPDFLNNKNAYVSEIEEFHNAMVTCIQDYKKALLKTEVLYSEIKSKYNIDNVYQTHLNLYKCVI